MDKVGGAIQRVDNPTGRRQLGPATFFSQDGYLRCSVRQYMDDGFLAARSTSVTKSTELWIHSLGSFGLSDQAGGRTAASFAISTASFIGSIQTTIQPIHPVHIDTVFDPDLER